MTGVLNAAKDPYLAKFSKLRFNEVFDSLFFGFKRMAAAAAGNGTCFLLLKKKLKASIPDELLSCIYFFLRFRIFSNFSILAPIGIFARFDIESDASFSDFT